MVNLELEKASMAFKLKNGEILLISNDDITEIARKMITEMMISKQNVIYMVKDTNIEKCNLLYKMIIEQKDTMSKSLKESYLRLILKLLNTNDTELTTLKEKVEKNPQ